MNWMTNSAAIDVAESGTSTSLKKRIGPAPSTRAASTSSSGIVRKNWRNRNVAVAEAISGTVKPAYVLIMPRSATTLYVGRMRTSTGSISVTKIIQKNTIRSGKRKYTIANADRSEMVILPTEMI